MSLLLFLATAWAGPAEDLLAEVDAASNRGDDAHIVLDVQTATPEGDPVDRTLEIWQKGTDKRLVRFTAPARLAGVGLLVPDGDTLYLYLPSYGRVRRVVGEARGDSFMGTDFTLEDLSRIAWAEDWTPLLTEADHLTLVPKDPSSTATARVELWVRPTDHLPAKVEHYDAKGAMLRRIAFDDVRDVDGRPLAHLIVVDDMARSQTTRASVRTASFNQGLDDDVFTVHHLSQ